MAFKMNGFSGLKQKVKETEPTRNASQDPYETTVDPNDPRIIAFMEEAELDQRRKEEEARLRSKQNPNPHSPHSYYYEDGRGEMQISDNPADWGWENEPEYIIKRTYVHGGHNEELVINPFGPLATSNKPKLERFEEALGMTGRLTSGGGTWRDRAYLRHEGKE
tara:strand:- start:186 stop:677 length:492 start_codon:yes stop_codon:yes gene_type:complete